MILYHGTSEKCGLQILKDGVIKSDIERRYHNSIYANGKLIDLSSTNGYVYLSNCIGISLNYANKSSLLDKNKHFYLFKLNIDDNLLLSDVDEVRIHTDIANKHFNKKGRLYYTKSLKLFNSVCVKDDIDIKNSLSQYLISDTFTVEPLDTSSEVHKYIKDFIRHEKNNNNLEVQKLLHSFTNKYEWNII